MFNYSWMSASGVRNWWPELAPSGPTPGPAVAEFIGNDERGKRIPEYLTSLGEQLMSDQKIALEELASLRENLEHIKDTVSMQQSTNAGTEDILSADDALRTHSKLSAYGRR